MVALEHRIDGCCCADDRLEGKYNKGFYFASENVTLCLTGLVQADARFFSDWHVRDNDFYIRRARIIMSGTLYQDWAYRFYEAFEGSSAKLYEAWLEYRGFPCVWLRVGQYRQPFSMEAMYSAKWIRFIERAMGPTNLAPFEDIGFQISGKPWCEKVEYAVSVFNGQGKNKGDIDSDKDVTARIVLQPFRDCVCSWFEDLRFGMSLATGRESKVLEGETYTTAAGTPFLMFSPWVFQDGAHSRAGIELEWLCGPFGLQSESLISRRVGVQDFINRETMDCRAWYIAASYVLTGEKQQHNKALIPCCNFDPCCCHWGAWEVGIRYEEFETDENVFRAGLVSGSERVTAWTGGLTWWPNPHVKVMGNFVHTNFNQTIIINGRLMDQENAFLCQFQYCF